MESLPQKLCENNLLEKFIFFALGFSALFFILPVQAQPTLPSCGNITILGDAMIDGRLFSKGKYQLNTFGISCQEVLGLNGILGNILGLGKNDRLPAPWTSLHDAVGAPKVQSGPGTGFRLQKLADIPLMVDIPEQLLTGIKTSRNDNSSAVLKFGASADLGLSSSHSFASSDSITVNATIAPQNQDVGSPANIYVVARTIEGGKPVFRSLGRLGMWELWSGAINSLAPAYTISALGEELRLLIYSGKLAPNLDLAIFIGYSSVSANEVLLHYNGDPFVLTVGK